MTTPLYDRMRMRLDRQSGLSNLDQTVLKYGYVEGERFSFEDHEFQQQIIKDTSSRIAVRKCSQVGLSEVMVQKLLAMAASLRHVRVIFTLPTKEMATAFSKDRIDGAIEQSDFYKGLTTAGTNSASQKKIGSSHIYVAGSFGANQAISVPAEIVICDEVDFSNPIVLGKLNSRLRHAKNIDEHGYRGIKYMFSTPTVHGFGVDNDFQRGDQQYYQCKCEHCETWVLPTIEDFRIPGWDKPIAEFSSEHVDSHDVSKTIMVCNNCGKDLYNSLCTPERRQWVATFPERNERSYQVSPWDVPKYNTPVEIIRQVADYPLKSDFYNFVLGLPYTDSQNSFNTSREHQLLVMNLQKMHYLSSVVRSTMVAGLDVGKYCHLIVGLPVGHQLHVVYSEVIENSRTSPAAPKIIERFDFYNCAIMVVDSGPDITLVNTLTATRENIFASVYVNSIRGPQLFEEKSNQIVNVDRTKALSYLLNKHNSGDILYHSGAEGIFKHLATTVKIRKNNPDGTITERFTASTKNDHWVHALNYTMVAKEMRYGIGQGESKIYAPVEVTRLRVGSKAPSQQQSTGRRLV